jgi:small subunit ribosomal protein S8
MATVTDPIADLLTRIRNGLQADHEFAEIPTSKLKVEIARILKEQGYIDDYSVEAAAVGEMLRIRLKYTDGRKPVITGLKRASRPGRRTYVNAREIPKVLGGMGTAIVSTSRGVMTGHDARRQGVGGEVVAHVW